MNEQIESQDPYTAYVNVKIVDLWYEVYLKELNKSAADKAVDDFKSFLQGV